MLTKLFSSINTKKTYQPRSPRSSIYTPSGFMAFQDIFPDEQLDQAYTQLTTVGIDGFIFRDLPVIGNLTPCIEKFAAHHNPIYLAAILKYQGTAKATHPMLAINAVNYPGCLSVMGAYGITLNREIPSRIRGQDEVIPAVPPPLVHAALQHNLASLQVLAKYNAISTVADHYISQSICAQENIAAKGNQDNCIMLISAICDAFTQKSKAHLLAILSRSDNLLRTLLAKDCDRVLNYLITCGLNLRDVYGPSGGAIIAAQHGSIDCLKIIITQQADLRQHRTCAGSYFPLAIFIPILWPCLIMSRTSPLKEAQKSRHEASIKLVEAWLLTKKEGRLGHTKEDLQAFITNWEISQNTLPIAVARYCETPQHVTPIAVKSMEVST